MKIDRRITNGLAWAGVVLVVGVPTADLLSAQLMGNERAPQVAMIEPDATAVPATTEAPVPATKPAAQVASTTPSNPATATGGGAVDTFLQSGKALPSYITGGDAAPQQAAVQPATKPQTAMPASKPAATQQASAPAPQRVPIVTQPAQQTTEVAALPTKVAPIPMPLSMRPKPVVPVVATTTAPVLIIPDREVAPQPDRVIAPLPPANVNSADLDNWESGPLSEFLAARQRQQGGSNAQVTYQQQDGFYLDEALDTLRPRGNQYIGPADDGDYFVPFGN